MDLIGEVERVLVREREGEGEEGRLGLRVGEHVAELQRELVVAVEKGGGLRHDASPLLLLCWHHPEYRLQPLIVQFGLEFESFRASVTDNWNRLT